MKYRVIIKDGNSRILDSSGRSLISPNSPRLVAALLTNSDDHLLRTVPASVTRPTVRLEVGI